MKNPINVCVGGGTGWAGSALSRGILEQDDLLLTSVVSRSKAGKNLEEEFGISGSSTPIYASTKEATSAGGDVYVEYTKPEIAKENILTALTNGYNVVVGTSGLSDQEYEEIEKKALETNLGVLAVGNFAITVVLLQKFAEIAAKYVPNWEIIDYASAAKVDIPSGTARELAHRLGTIRHAHLEVPIEDISGRPEARGASMNGSQVHSVRLPAHVLGIETIFAQADEKLTIRHDAGSSAEPYVQGALLAIRKVGSFVGLNRGLDTVMDF